MIILGGDNSGFIYQIESLTLERVLPRVMRMGEKKKEKGLISSLRFHEILY